MLRRAAALTYYKSLPAAAGMPASLHTLSSRPSRSRSQQDGGNDGGVGCQQGTRQGRAALGDGAAGLSGGAPLMHQQLQQLLELLCAGRGFGRAVRMVEGFRLAQLLVACSNLRAETPPDFQVPWGRDATWDKMLAGSGRCVGRDTAWNGMLPGTERRLGRDAAWVWMLPGMGCCLGQDAA